MADFVRLQRLPGLRASLVAMASGRQTILKKRAGSRYTKCGDRRTQGSRECTLRGRGPAACERRTKKETVMFRQVEVLRVACSYLRASLLFLALGWALAAHGK